MANFDNFKNMLYMYMYITISSNDVQWQAFEILPLMFLDSTWRGTTPILIECSIHSKMTSPTYGLNFVKNCNAVHLFWESSLFCIICQFYKRPLVIKMIICSKKKSWVNLISGFCLFCVMYLYLQEERTIRGYI